MSFTVLFSAFVALGLACGQDGDSLSLARELLKRGKPKQVIVEARKVLDEDPSQPEANYLLGLALLRTGEPALAVWPLRRASESSEYAVEAGILMAQAAMKGRNTHDALGAIEQVLEIAPDNTDALEIRMTSDLRAKHFGKALAGIDRILELQPDNLEVLVPRVLALIGLERIDDAGEALERATLALLEKGPAESPRMQARLCIVTGVFTFEKGEGETEPAVALLEECLERFPNNDLVVSETVRFYDQILKRKRATEILQKIYEDTGTSKSRKALADRMRQLKQPDEVLRLLLEETEENPSPDSWFQLGDHYAQQDDFGAAVSAFEQALARNKNPDPMLRFAYADTLIQKGDYKKARREAAKVGQSVFSDLLIGRILLEEGDPQGALKAFESGIRLWPNNGVARFLAGQTAEQLGDFGRAVSEYREALRRDPGQSDSGLALAELFEAMGSGAGAIDAIRRFARAHSGDPRAYKTTVRIAHKLGQRQVVSEALTRLARLPGQEASAVAIEAQLLSSGKGPKVAVEAVERAKLDLTDPANAEVLRVLLEQYEALGDNSSAEERITAALAAHPEEAVFHELNARVLRAKDQPVAPAREAYERSIELDPENVAALTGLAEITAEAGDRSEAVALYDRAAEADPDDAEAPYAAIQLLLVPEPTSEAETEEVVRRLEEMLREHPRHGRAANDLAKVFIARKDLDRAMALARRADKFILAIEASETIGWIHLLRKEPEPAVKALTRAVERRPHAATPRYRLGLAHLADGDEESARTIFREVIDAEADPESDQALAQLARLDAGDAPE